MNTAVYSITDFYPHYYNVHILTDGMYCGVGKFCRDIKEVLEFIEKYNVISIKKI